MIKRKMWISLSQWKETSNKKCLVVTGARQVGKTRLIEEFGKKSYDEVVDVNFKETPDAAEIFSGSLKTEDLLQAFRFRFPQKEMPQGKTLFFFDEIQECPEAITSLKFWTQDGRYDVIASGSMLGIDYKRASSYPVGYVEFLKLYGLDLEEFLDAVGVTEEMKASIRQSFEERRPVQPAIHTQMMKWFRIYIALGGMPEVVQTWLDTHDFRDADRVQREILQGYLYDIAHYATAPEKIKAEKCYLSLSRQLLQKENHKFQYKEVEKGGKAQKYMSSVEWLLRADIAAQSMNVTDISFELKDYELEDNFRLYTTDLSLLLAMRDFSLKQGIVEDSLTAATKGGIYECAAADQLIKKGCSLHFYKNETKKREIEFLIERNGEVIPIEVKGGNARALSLRQVMKSHPELPIAYKLANSNIGVGENRIVTLPFYMVMFL